MGHTFSLEDYDHIIVAFSGGKDSLACVLHILDQGVPKEKVELWHHDIDGREGNENLTMDWPVTPDYCRKVAEAIGVKIYFSWKVGGFERELLRENARTAPTKFETPEEGVKQTGGVRGKLGTRRKFPQVSGDLRVRWCSAYLKIDVCTSGIINQKRFEGKKIMVVTGERAEESSGRAKYKVFEPDRADNRDGKRNVRHVDRWRPVHGWTEKQVWDIIEKYKVNPHPCYHLGWGRCSCSACIFGSANQWASLRKVIPEQFESVASLEKEFGYTIQRKKSVEDMANAGTPYEPVLNGNHEALIASASSRQYTEPAILEDWKLPAGAFGESCGPT